MWFYVDIVVEDLWQSCDYVNDNGDKMVFFVGDDFTVVLFQKKGKNGK